MKKQKNIELEFDRLTNSIQNVITGDSFPTDITLITIDDLKFVMKKTGWLFDWKFEYKQPERDVYKINNREQSIIILKL